MKSDESEKTSVDPRRRAFGPTHDYDMTKHGLTLFDEARRATADLARHVRIWECFAESNVKAMDRYDIVEDEILPEGLQDRLRLIENNRREQVAKQVVEFWPAWELALVRAVRSLESIDWSCHQLDPTPARKSIVELRRIFQRPPRPRVDTTPPGEHLLRSAGPLGANRRFGSNLALYPIGEILKALCDFSDEVGLLDEAGIQAVRRALELGGPAGPSDPGQPTRWRMIHLVRYLDLSDVTIRKWYALADPPISNQRTRGSFFSHGEIARLADGAEADGRSEVAALLRKLPARPPVIPKAETGRAKKPEAKAKEKPKAKNLPKPG